MVCGVKDDGNYPRKRHKGWVYVLLVPDQFPTRNPPICRAKQMLCCSTCNYIAAEIRCLTDLIQFPHWTVTAIGCRLDDHIGTVFLGLLLGVILTKSNRDIWHGCADVQSIHFELCDLLTSWQTNKHVRSSGECHFAWSSLSLDPRKPKKMNEERYCNDERRSNAVISDDDRSRPSAQLQPNTWPWSCFQGLNSGGT